MSDTLEIFGDEFTNVTGIKATDENNQIKTYIRPQGTKTISANGSGIDVMEYASVDVSVPTPTGNIDITQAGVTDVTNYATATVPSAGEITNYVYIGGLAYVLNEDAGTIYIDKTAERTGQICADNSGWIETDQHGYIANSTTTIEVADSYNLPTQSATSITPTESSQTAVAKGKFTTGAVTVSAIPSNYVGSGITRRSSTDLTVSGATVTAPSGYYSAQASKSVANGSAGTPTATKGVVSNHSVSVTPSVTNTTGYITGSTKTGTAVTVSASELVSGSETKTQNGTYDVTNLAEIVVDVQGGGSSTISVGKTTRTLASASSSIQFTGLSGNPTSFAVTSSADITTNTNGVTAVVFDGTSLHGQILSTQATADTGFTKSYSGGTLTITATTGTFQANEYKLVYTYGGSTSDIETADIQVGSGATSITFPVTGRPIYWSCIFKSDFSTSSGYQRTIEVVNDGTSTYGMALDSTAKALTSWTANYSGGNLIISSQGTNNGGYFHQPGYYQLTYAVDDSAPEYQSKTVTPTTSQQVVQADSGYDALSQVTVNAIPSQYIIPTGNLAITENGNNINVSQYATVSVNVSGGTSKNVQVLQSTSRTNSSSLTKVLGDLTVTKTGTYDVYWSGGRSNTSTSYTWGTRLYIDGTGYGTENTSWSNNCQSNHLSNVSLTANQKLSVYARGRTGSYYTFAPMLAIVEA